MEEIPKMTPNKEARRSHHIARRSRNRDFHMQPPSLKLSRHVRLFGRDSPEGQMASAKHHLATSLSSFVLPRKRMRIDFPADIGDSSRDWSPQITARASATSAAKPQSPIFLLNTDVLAEVMLFLEPTETLQVMTMPLSKSWLKLYGSQPDVWEILCHSAPFKAPKIESQEIPIALSSTKSTRPYLSGRYRLLYGSFVKCIKYLRQLKCDALNGRTHRSSMGNTCQFVPYSSLEECPPPSCSKPRETCVKQHGQKPPFPGSAKKAITGRPRLGVSMITSRLLGVSSQGQHSHLNLPRSCAVFSIVNWMVAYPNVEGILLHCVRTLPFLLEDESQRLTAQRVGLVDVILRTMVHFPDCRQLHIAALHTMVLLGRPIGGKEGMLFDTAMSESPISGVGFLSGKPQDVNAIEARRQHKSLNGVEIMLNSMRHFESSERLQSMACWALVNLALVPDQKNMILSLRGIECTLRAMTLHPDSYDVQFRALFALINLVVVAKRPRELIFQDIEGGRQTEKDALDEVVPRVVVLVVRAMKNFCGSAAILNRACLILHNLSQSDEYLNILLETPHCYQMLEWCLTNYQTDEVLRKGALSAFQRLQVVLASREIHLASFPSSNS